MATQAETQDARVRLAEDIVANPIRYYRPRPTAKKFHLDCEHRSRWLLGGKQSTKSYSSVGENSMAVTGIESIHTPGALAKFRKPPLHSRHWCEDLKRAAEGVLLPIYFKLIPPRMLDRRRGRNEDGYNRDRHTLYLTNGSWIQFLSYEMPPMKGESVTLDTVVFDEPPPEALYESQYGRIAARAGQMWGAMTLDERRASHPIQWVDRRIRRRGDGQHINWWVVTTWENFACLMEEAATPEEAEAIEQAYRDWENSMSEDERAVVLRGEGGWACGLVFPHFNETVQANYSLLGPKDIVELAKKGYGKIRCGLDPGMDDPAAMTWNYTHGKHPLPRYQLAEGDHIVYREYKQRGLHYKQHAKRLRYLCEGEPIEAIYAGIDLWERDKDGGPPQGRAFFDAFKGFCPIRKGNRERRSGFMRLSTWLEERPDPTPWSRLRIMKGKCPELVNEYYATTYEGENRRTGQRPDEVADGDDHLMDGQRYWAMSWPEQRRKPRLNLRLPRHPVTGVPIPSYVNLRALFQHVRRR